MMGSRLVVGQEHTTNLANLPNDILLEIIDIITRDYWTAAAVATEKRTCPTGRCWRITEILLGERLPHPDNATWHTHQIAAEHMRNVKIARLEGIDNQINFGINEKNWNPLLFSLAATCRQLRTRIMDDVILQCLRIRGLKERELASALEVFGEDRLQVTK
jgi:hypothetical protein